MDYPDGYGDSSLLEGRFAVSNSIFESNSATRGGAVYVRFGWCSISDSQFAQNDAYAAGALYADWAALQLRATQFATNTATLGGAVYVAENAGGVQMTDCSAVENVAGQGEFFKASLDTFATEWSLSSLAGVSLSSLCEDTKRQRFSSLSGKKKPQADRCQDSTCGIHFATVVRGRRLRVLRRDTLLVRGLVKDSAM